MNKPLPYFIHITYIDNILNQLSIAITTLNVLYTSFNYPLNDLFRYNTRINLNHIKITTTQLKQSLISDGFFITSRTHSNTHKHLFFSSDEQTKEVENKNQQQL